MEHSRLKNTAFSAATVALLFLLCEAVLRIAGFVGHDDADFRFIVRRVDNDLLCPDVVEDRTLFWKLRPSATLDLDGTPVRSNSLGFRTPEVRTNPAQDNFRIVYLGDSTTFGWRVPEHDRYSDVLQRVLESVCPGRQFETINLAIPGFSSFQARRTFETVGRSYNPDVVVVCVGTNDRQPSQDMPDEDVAKRIARPRRLHRLLSHARLYQLLRAVIAGARPSWGEPDVEPRVSPAAYERNLTALAGACAQAGADLIVVAPLRGRRYDDAPAKRPNAYRLALQRLVRGNRLRCVHVRSMTERSHVPNSHLFADIYHPNTLGHALVAVHLFEAIAKLPSFAACLKQANAETPRARVAQAQEHLFNQRPAEGMAHALLAMDDLDDALGLVVAGYTQLGAYEDAIRTGLDHRGRVLWSPGACAELARAYWLSGMPDSAVELLEHAVHIAPGLAAAKKRLDALTRVLKPASPRPRADSTEEYTQAICWALEEKEYDRAAQLSHAAARSYPEHGAFRFWRAKALRLQGEWRRAYAGLAVLSLTHHWHGDARIEAAQCLEELGELEQAFPLAKAAADLKPFSWRTQMAMAALAERTCSYREGLRAAHRALALKPKDQAARALLERLKQGDRRPKESP